MKYYSTFDPSLVFKMFLVHMITFESSKSAHDKNVKKKNHFVSNRSLNSHLNLLFARKSDSRLKEDTIC